MHFFLLILEILFNLIPDIIYKHSRFFKTLLKKSFEFILNKKIGFVLFFLHFMLLLSRIDSILEEQGYKKYLFEVYTSSHFKIIFTLLTKILIFYI